MSTYHTDEVMGSDDLVDVREYYLGFGLRENRDEIAECLKKRDLMDIDIVVGDGLGRVSVIGSRSEDMTYRSFQERYPGEHIGKVYCLETGSDYVLGIRFTVSTLDAQDRMSDELAVYLSESGVRYMALTCGLFPEDTDHSEFMGDYLKDVMLGYDAGYVPGHLLPVIHTILKHYCDRETVE